MSYQITSPIPGKIIWVATVDQTVTPYSVVTVVDAMKMENMIQAGVNSKITKVSVIVGERIQVGQILIEIE